MSYTHFDERASALINSFAAPGAIDAALLALLGGLCLYYAIAYLATHAGSLRHQVYNLRPCRQTRAIWTRRTKIKKF